MMKYQAGAAAETLCQITVEMSDVRSRPLTQYFRLSTSTVFMDYCLRSIVLGKSIYFIVRMSNLSRNLLIFITYLCSRELADIALLPQDRHLPT